MRKNTYIFLGLTLLLLVLALLDTCSGSVWISPHRLLALSPMQEQILLQLRLPKMLTAILAGASLSVAGLMMQTLFRNPDHVTDHALITWLSCTAHVADHAMITQLPCTGHMTDHALIT